MTTVLAPVRRARLTITAVFIAHGMLFASWAAHIPQVKAHLGIDDGTLGLALLGAPVGSITAMIIVARVLPRLGSKAMVAICLVGYCAAGPFVGLAPSAPLLALALFAWGAFLGALDVSMNTQAIAVEHAADRPLMNGLHGGWSIGAFIGAGLGALGVAIGASLAVQLAVLGPVVLLGLARLLPALVPDAAPTPVDDESGDGGRWSWVLLVLGAVAFASMFCESVPADWSSVYLKDTWSASAGVAGLGYTVFTLTMTAMRLSGNAALVRVPRHRLLPLLAAVGGVAFAISLIVGGIVATLVGFAILGFGVAVVVPTVFSVAGALPGRHAGVSVATVSAFGWAGFVLGPPLIGQLADATSLRAALWTVPVLAAVIAVVSARQLRPSTPVDPP